MSIRVTTLQRLSATRKSVFRVRWRVLTVDAEGNWSGCDGDGAESDPDSWRRWEHNYYLLPAYAFAGATQDTFVRKKLRPAGVVDQVPARLVWSALVRQSEAEPECVLEFERGRRRMVALEQPGYPGQLGY